MRPPTAPGRVVANPSPTQKCQCPLAKRFPAPTVTDWDPADRRQNCCDICPAPRTPHPHDRQPGACPVLHFADNYPKQAPGAPGLDSETWGFLNNPKILPRPIGVPSGSRLPGPPRIGPHPWGGYWRKGGIRRHSTGEFNRSNQKKEHAKAPQSELDCAQERPKPAAAIPRTAWRVMEVFHESASHG
jgi:hypothetical protein